MIKSAFQDHFAQIPQINRPRSQFKRVSRHKHTFDAGLLIPFYLDDVVPGDTFNVQAAMFARLATPLFPIMDNMYLETFWFYVPNRLVWTNFVKQHGERDNPSDSVAFTTPEMNTAALTGGSAPQVGDLWDNFGLPMTGPQYLDNISALPFRMYNLIWNQWFRDQDLDSSVNINTDNGPDDYTDYALLRIRKFKDYFTTMRPQPQKGTAVNIPLGTSAPVYANGQNIQMSFTGDGAPPREVYIEATGDLILSGTPPGSNQAVQYWGTQTGLYTDLSASTAATLNQLRDAITVQQMYELDMRGGSRYVEMVYNHYGVINPDFRLQRPEFLSYARSAVNVHPVPQTSATGTGTAQGNLAAFGTASSRNGFVKSFTEHGYVIGLVTVRSDLSYQECVDRHWSRQTRVEYYYPVFANLGEQAVLNQELRNNPSAATNNTAVAGYQERWAEYRFKTSKITGLFRSSAASSLDAWHLSQELTFPATLNSTFLQEDPPLDRAIAVAAEPHFIFDSMVENNSARPMPVYSVPGLMRL